MTALVERIWDLVGGEEEGEEEGEKEGEEEGDDVLFEVIVGQVSPGLMSQVALSAALCCISRVSVKF